MTSVRWFVASAVAVAMSSPAAVAGERLGADQLAPRPTVTRGASGSDRLERVRARDAAAEQLLQYGATRSSTFRALLEGLRRSDVIVYVQVQHDPASTPGGSLRFIGSGGGFRWVMATVDTGSSRRGAVQENLVTLTATLGNELQHAREVAAVLSIRSGADFDTHYRTVGIDVRRNAVDTHAARHVGRMVAKELTGPSRMAERTESSALPTAEAQLPPTPIAFSAEAVPLAKTGATKRGSTAGF